MNWPNCARLGRAVLCLCNCKSVHRIPRMRLIHCLSLLLMMPGLLAAQTSPRQASSANSSGSTSGRPVRIYTLGSKNRPSASNVLGKSNAVDSNPAPNADLQYYGGPVISNVAANASSTATTAVRLPTGIPVNTTFYIVACANGNNQVKESNTNNNCSGVAFTVTH